MYEKPAVFIPHKHYHVVLYSRWAALDRDAIVTPYEDTANREFVRMVMTFGQWTRICLWGLYKARFTDDTVIRMYECHKDCLSPQNQEIGRKNNVLYIEKLI